MTIAYTQLKKILRSTVPNLNSPLSTQSIILSIIPSSALVTEILLKYPSSTTQLAKTAKFHCTINAYKKEKINNLR